MSEAVVVAIITGLTTLIGTVFAVLQASKKTDEAIKINQAVTDTKIEELTREVRLHNGFAEKIPVLQEQVRNLDHRISELEDK